MKVILKKEVKGLGHINEVVNVKDGYAKNYLFKNDMAVMFTDKNVQQLNKTLQKLADFEKEQVEKFSKIKDKIEKVTLHFSLTENNGKTSGSISIPKIIETLESEHKIKLDKFMFNGAEKTFGIGIHFVQIELYKGVIAKLKLEIISK